MEWRVCGERFLELTNLLGNPIAINVSSIAAFGSLNEDGGTWITLKTPENFSVKQKYAEIKEAIQKDGRLN